MEREKARGRVDYTTRERRFHSHAISCHALWCIEFALIGQSLRSLQDRQAQGHARACVSYELRSFGPQLNFTCKRLLIHVCEGDPHLFRASEQIKQEGMSGNDEAPTSGTRRLCKGDSDDTLDTVDGEQKTRREW